MESVRQLLLSDIDQMIELRIGIQNYDLRYLDESIIIPKEEILRKKTKKYIVENLNKSLFMFGLFIDDKLVSNCGYVTDNHFPEYKNLNGKVGYICNVFTKEEYRKKGYQRKVFEYCLEFAKNNNIKVFELSSKNDYAIKMYKSFGFHLHDHMYKMEVNK